MKARTIEIAGGGIAGLALAGALARRGVAVCLHEAGSYPRHRLCGEFLNGVGESTLHALGLSTLFSDALCHREMVWFIGEKKVAQSALGRPVRALSRWEMDRRLVAWAREQGAEVHERSRLVAEPREGLVWAAGRFLQKDSSWLGLKAHYQGLKLSAGLEMHLGSAGYLGLTPVEDGRVNVCGLFHRQRGVQGKGSALLENYLQVNGLTGLGQRLQAAEADESSLTGVSGLRFGSQSHPPDLLTLGDSERIVPPFTGNGMSMALEAAESALGPLSRYAGGDCSWAEARQAVRSLLAKRFSHRLTLARGLHSVLLHPLGRCSLAWAARSRCLPIATLNQLLT
ncbi:FAD-dependent monooxygenase [Roseibacillus ishigakijimensis]|uniref:FAD-binding domain-containing protein n=1 Tax=Roseibacillus ishigakijimensis TaxID=454146 RepID=A0A934VHI4_9BACT|nr:FAD-dependent monooxygenase [Roseibacillus ishigakijimensis]MBK1833988.1 hypothetical protein [Roseibacillus ishigakijimensis]